MTTGRADPWRERGTKQDSCRLQGHRAKEGAGNPGSKSARPRKERAVGWILLWSSQQEGPEQRDSKLAESRPPCPWLVSAQQVKLGPQAQGPHLENHLCLGAATSGREQKRTTAEPGRRRSWKKDPSTGGAGRNGMAEWQPGKWLSGQGARVDPALEDRSSRVRAGLCGSQDQTVGARSEEVGSGDILSRKTWEGKEK